MVKITKKVAEKMLGEVPWNERFSCSDGRVLKSLPELEAALKEMSEEAFRYHSNEVKSDFSNWREHNVSSLLSQIQYRQ